MITDTNKQKGNAGLALAIAYYSTNGYTVSIPLNDTQDYDLLADNGSIVRVQAKFSTQTNNGFSVIPLRSLGGTSGKVYKRLTETNIDLVFFANSSGEMWSIPKTAITQQNVTTLNSRYNKYRVTL